jgi:hypothetical protein
MNAKDIEKRRDIARSRARGGRSVTYAELVKQFKTSNRVVAEALSHGVEYWDGLLGTPAGSAGPVAPGERWEHELVAAKEGAPGVWQVQVEGHADWVAVDEDTVSGICDERGRQGWRLVSVQRVASGKLPSFSGVYELAFTRRVQGPADG